MNTHTTQNGFTLVETLVAIAVLLLVIIGPMTVAQKGIQNAYFAKEQVTATFLAQEAIEAVREKRDADALSVYKGGTSNVDTADWMPSCTSGCAYNVANNSFGACSFYNGCLLKINDDGNYNYTSGAGSPFTRIVTTGTTMNGATPVSVDVSWNAKIFGAATRHVILQTWIYDQYQRYEP